MTKTWSTNQRKFQRWLALPKPARIPETQELLADELGVHSVTLSKWKSQDGFRDEVAQLTIANLTDDMADVFRSIVREAKRGSAPHAKLYCDVLQLAVTQLNVTVAAPLVLRWAEDENTDD